MLCPFIAGRVLDVGAGIGSNIAYLHHAGILDGTCVEPDAALARRIEGQIAAGTLSRRCRVRFGKTIVAIWRAVA